jgi:hypothetical protein
MMPMRLWTSIAALMLVLGVVLAPAIAQKPKDGSASQPADAQMSRMMTMMEQMQEQMKQMHDDMAGMKGMRQMMQEHHAQMQKGCPGMSSPDRPKPGG